MRRDRRWLAAAGVVLVLAAPPLQLVSTAAFCALWYAGLALVGAWLALDIRAGHRRGLRAYNATLEHPRARPADA